MNTTHSSKKAFFGAAIGTLVEYYDYALFSTFLPIVSPIFFPGASAYQSLTKSYFIFLIAMLARPFGGAFFGYLGDVIGRPKALLASMYGIALSSIAIGITPSYQTIGIAALVIVMVAKSLQVACFGGEYNGAGIYVVEHAKNKKEALSGSLLTAVMLSGGFFASLIGILLTYPWMPAWSWRIAFLFGGLIGVFGILYRKHLARSPHFVAADSKQHTLKALVKQFPHELLAGIFIGALATAPFTTALTLIMPILTAKGFITNHQFMFAQSIITLFAILTLIPVGIVADKKSPIAVMRFSCLLLVVLSYPLLSIVDKGNLVSIILAMISIIMIQEMFLGPSNAYLKSLFPMQFRYRGSSISFCIGMSFFGGLTPLVENYLYNISGKFSITAIWLVFLGIGALVCFERVRRKQAISPYPISSAEIASP